MGNTIEAIYGLTPMQEGMFFHYLKNKETTEYILQTELVFKGDIKTDAVRDSLYVLAHKYDVLRTAFANPKKSNKPVQVILGDRTIECNFIKLPPEQDVVGSINAVKESDLKRGFDLEKDSLLRVTFVKVSDDETTLLWSAHHIIMDGWCISLLFRDFLSIYEKFVEGQSMENVMQAMQKEKALLPDYRAYVKIVEGENINIALDYWLDLLSGYQNIADLWAVGKNLGGSSLSSVEQFSESDKFSQRFVQFANDNKITPSNIVETAWGILLQRFNHTDDVVFGKVVSGRNVNLPNIESAVGLFINTIPVRVSYSEDCTVMDLLLSSHKQSVDSMKFDHCPLAEIQSQHPMGVNLIKSLFVFENYYVDNAVFSANKSISVELKGSREQTNYDTTLNASYTNALNYQLMYNANVYNAEDAKAILRYLSSIVQDMVSNPSKKISEIEVLSEEEKKSVVQQHNWIDVNYPVDKTIVDLFEEQVAETPNNIAVKCNDKVLTYDELNRKANQLARKLRNHNVGRDNFVALYTERSLEMVIGILAVIKAGGAYVPINTLYPMDRVEYIINDCKPNLILTFGTELSQDIDIPQIDLENEDCFVGDDSNLDTINKPEDIIYVIYTSGTTGKPKGVMIEHRNVVRLFFNDEFQYDFNENDVWMMFHSYGFDFSVWELYGAVLFGGKLIVPTNDVVQDSYALMKMIKEEGLTVLNQVPSAFYSLLKADTDDNELAVRYLIFGGEALDPTRLDKWYARHPGCKIVNMYGITETTVHVTYKEIGENEIAKGVSDIGTPIPTLAMYIMNGMQLCGTGMPGELCVSGAGLARGYLNMPELTNQKFIDNPFGEGKLYRSGDLARELPDGTIEYLGRIDEQVKIRGFRIELGEIASVIRKISDVQDAVVIARDTGNGEKALCAYIVSAAEINTLEIREQIKKDLPAYMVPSYIAKIDSIPLTRNGKLDRNALPEIGMVSERPYVAPEGEIEEAVAKAFEDILGVTKVGRDDNFFELGGHSLKVMKLINKLELELNLSISIKNVFDNPTVKSLSAAINNETEQDCCVIPVVEKQDYYPTTSIQRRLYAACIADKDSTTYNMPYAFEITGDIDVDRITEAFNELVNRHEILRTSFVVRDGDPVQAVKDSLNFVPVIHKVEQCEKDDVAQKFHAFVKPFDLERAPLLRVEILIDSLKHGYIFIDMHHIISDGESMNIVINEFCQLYSGQKLKPVNVQYKDYTVWMNRRDLASQESYWLGEYSDSIPVLDIPLDYTRPKFQSHNGRTIHSKFDLAAKDLEHFCTQNNITEYMLFLGSVSVLLAKYSRQDDIVIGSPVSGRTTANIENTLGAFINTLALRTHPANKNAVSVFLNEIKDICLKAYENQEYPFDELVNNVVRERNIGRNPLFDVMFVYQNNVNEINLPSITIKRHADEHSSSKFDLTITVYRNNGKFEVDFEYCTDLFKEDTISAMIDHWKIIVQDMVSNPSKKISEIEVLSEEEKKSVVQQHNWIDVNYPVDKTIVDLFEEQVAETPNNIAVKCNDKVLTYDELNRKANQLARKLRNHNVGRDNFVALYTERSLEMVIGILAVIKAGGAYVPINTLYPMDRVEYIINDCKPNLILTFGTELSQDIDIPQIDLENEDCFVGDDSNLDTINKPEDIIYVIYTSGTTGKPKGVMIEHRNVVRLFFNDEFQYDFNENDVWMMFHSYGFDFSVWELYGAVLFGGKLIVPTNDVVQDSYALMKMIKEEGLTVLNQVPSAFYSLLKADTDDNELAVRYLIFGGEALDPTRLDKWYARHPGCKIVNMYGITETTVHVTYKEIGENEIAKGVSDIGTPIPTLAMYIMNGMQLCGTGMPGELCVSGAGLARGYLNMPELTNQKFIDNPFGEGKLYRSGDLARELPDGTIEYLGRIDEQVKIRGFRIELGEIASVIRKISDVQDAVVIARDTGNGEKALCAYIVSAAEINTLEIREQIKKDLPAYMVPSYIAKIDSIPLTRNGKLDRNALPEIGMVSERPYVAPEGEIEEAVAKAFEDILGVTKVGRDDNFFELGGDSIKAIRIVSNIHEAGFDVTVKDVMKEQVVHQIASVATVSADDSEQYSQDDFVGEFKLSPIQQEFFNWELKKPNHYNQAIMLKSNERISLDGMQAALNCVVKHHDILRACFVDGRAEISDVDKFTMPTIDCVDLTKLGESEAYDAILANNNRVHESLDIEMAVTFRVVIYRLKSCDHLLLCSHHLVIDWVSWQILINDMLTVYNQYLNGYPCKLPSKTATFNDWVNYLYAYRDAATFSSETKYWGTVTQQIQNHYSYAKPSQRNIAQVEKTVASDVISRLQAKANQIYNVDMQELLLSAFTIACNKWKQFSSISISIEGHGREEHLNGRINITRTVGWFTCIYPVVINFNDDIETLIIDTKETLRAIPNHGVGLSLSKNVDALNIDNAYTDFCFNYLGELGGFGVDNTGFTQSEIPIGETIAKDNGRVNAISVDCFVKDGNLHITLSYDKSIIDQDDATRLLVAYANAINMLYDFCYTKEEAVKTISDLSTTDILEDELSELNSLLDEIN